MEKETSRGLSRSITAGIMAVVKKYNLPEEEAHKVYADAFVGVMREYGIKCPSWDEHMAKARAELKGS